MWFKVLVFVSFLGFFALADNDEKYPPKKEDFKGEYVKKIAVGIMKKFNQEQRERIFLKERFKKDGHVFMPIKIDENNKNYYKESRILKFLENNKGRIIYYIVNNYDEENEIADLFLVSFLKNGDKYVIYDKTEEFSVKKEKDKLVSKKRIRDLLIKYGYDFIKHDKLVISLEEYRKRFGLKETDERYTWYSEDLANKQNLLTEEEFSKLRELNKFKVLEKIYPAFQNFKRKNQTFFPENILIELLNDVTWDNLYMQKILKLEDSKMKNLAKLFSYVKANEGRNYVYSLIGRVADELSDIGSFEVAMKLSMKFVTDGFNGEFKKNPDFEYELVDPNNEDDLNKAIKHIEWGFDYGIYNPEFTGNRARDNFARLTKSYVLDSLEHYKIIGHPFFRNTNALEYYITGYQNNAEAIISEILLDTPISDNDNITAKIRYFKNKFSRDEITKEDLYAIDHMSLKFLDFLKNNWGINHISFNNVGGLPGTRSIPPVHLKYLAAISNDQCFSFIKDLYKNGILSQMQEHYSYYNRDVLNPDMIYVINKLCINGGNLYLEEFLKYRKGYLTKNIDVLDIEVLGKIADIGGIKFFEEYGDLLIGLNDRIAHRYDWADLLRSEYLGQDFLDFMKLLKQSGISVIDKYINDYIQSQQIDDIGEFYHMYTILKNEELLDKLIDLDLVGLPEIERYFISILLQRDSKKMSGDKYLNFITNENKYVKYLRIEPRTIDWAIENKNVINKLLPLIKNIYSDHGKVSAFDMSLISAIYHNENNLGNLYDDRDIMLNIVKKIYLKNPQISFEKPANERYPIESISRLDLLKAILLFDLFNKDQAIFNKDQVIKVKEQIGLLIWKDINLFGDKNKDSSELGFDLYLKNGQLYFHAVDFHTMVPVNNSSNYMILYRETEDGEFARKKDYEKKDNFLPLFAVHFHATSENSKRYSAPSGLLSAQENKKFAADMRAAYTEGINGVVITSMGVDNFKININVDFFRSGIKENDDDISALNIDIGVYDLPYKNDIK
jgi:hypothetical protein